MIIIELIQVECQTKPTQKEWIYIYLFKKWMLRSIAAESFWPGQYDCTCYNVYTVLNDLRVLTENVYKISIVEYCYRSQDNQYACEIVSNQTNRVLNQI